MKGIILAGGLGTRLSPLTLATNKHLLPVYDRCMVEYPINSLLRAGVDRIMIVTGGPHAGDFLRVLGNGRKLGITHLEYTYQEHEGGIAEALGLCEDFADGEPIAVILGDNITNADFRVPFSTFRSGAHLFFKRVPDPQRFGVPVFNERNQVMRIEEKPGNPASTYAVTGFYLYDARVFEIIRTLKPSSRGELEITDVNNAYLHNGALSWTELDGYWTDAGTFESLYYANTLIARERGWVAPEPLAETVESI
ncbi:MAG: sugar phosphate nucleotidyltransferase [Armatimonadota bacterium]